MMRPPVVYDASEFDDIGQVQNIGVDLGFADGRAVKPCFGINVEPAQVDAQGGTVLEFVIDSDAWLFRQSRRVGRYAGIIEPTEFRGDIL